ncbi:MAG: HAD family hydrolase [Halanaerobiales bacterium]
MDKLEAVIFDMDGVIIDSEPIHYQANLQLFKKMNIQVTRDEYEGFIGLSNTEVWSRLKEKHNLNSPVEELVSEIVESNIKVLKGSQVEPINGIKPLLDKLRKVKLKVALASSSPTEYIRQVLEKLKIKEYFETTVSGEELKNGKPDPDIFLHTAELINVKPGNCLVIEDSENGVKAAKAAGMKCIGYNNLNSGSQNLDNADIIINSITEINLNFINKLF